MSKQASKPDPALHAALGRKMNFDDGGEVSLDEDSNANAGLAPVTRAALASDSLQPLTQASNTPSTPQTGGGRMQMPGQSQFGRMNDAEVPTFPKINVVSNAYSPQMRALPTPQARQQAAAAALAPFINALSKLKAQQ